MLIMTRQMSSHLHVRGLTTEKAWLATVVSLTCQRWCV